MKNWGHEQNHVNAHRILILSKDANENLQKNLTVYLFTNSGLEEEKIINLLQSLPLLLKDKVMNTLEIFEKKGFDIRSEINLKNE